LTHGSTRCFRAIEEMNGIKLEGFDIAKLRERLRKMTDAQLLEFGRAARQLCGPEANFGKPPREVFVTQLKEARAEWRRRHPKNSPAA
jgi:hypothetical protein